jgi:hypothetical protein
MDIPRPLFDQLVAAWRLMPKRERERFALLLVEAGYRAYTRRERDKRADALRGAR